jgi:hypothetical protein
MCIQLQLQMYHKKSVVMKKLIFIGMLIILQSCMIQKQNHVIIYGNIWINSGRDNGIVYGIDSRYKIDKVNLWPDTLLNKYVKVTGVLKKNNDRYENDTNTNISRNFVKYTIKHATIEILNNDSIMNLIDSAHARCSEIRRLINRLQVDRILDSLVSSDSIILLDNPMLHSKIPMIEYINKGSKTVFFFNMSLINYYKIPEYFVFSRYPEIAGSEYDIEFTLIKIVKGVKTEKKYQITGNCNKIFLTPI